MIDAIKSRRVVRLAYARQADGVLSLHYVAPVDVRPGDSPRMASTMYLWAYCIDEKRIEMHLLDRVRAVQLTDGSFDPDAILRAWPVERWPIPATWTVERRW